MSGATATGGVDPIATPVDRVVDHITCLGCGCTCDDIRATVSRHDGVDRIVAAVKACAMGVAWFGDGVVPGRASAGGAAPASSPMSASVTASTLVSLSASDAVRGSALDAIAALLTRAKRPMVYLAPDLSCEAHRTGVALADCLRAVLDSVTSSTTLGGVLAAQERGTASATLGEVRNRADLLVCWGVDPSARYPRYMDRYAPDASGACAAKGRTSRRVVAVDIGAARGPADADVRFAIEPALEVAVLTAAAAVVSGGSTPSQASDRRTVWQTARALTPILLAARYVAIVIDTEPTDSELAGGLRASALRHGARIALAHALNGVVRCGISTLRAGGNRSGADAVVVAHTGFPCAVDFGRGAPRYEPHNRSAESCLARGEIDAVLVLGSAAGLPQTVRTRLAGVPVAVIGPWASMSGVATHGYVDTGVAGIHDAGTALRMDDVPLPLTAMLEGPACAAQVVQALVDRVRGAVIAGSPFPEGRSR